MFIVTCALTKAQYAFHMSSICSGSMCTCSTTLVLEIIEVLILNVF